MISIGKYSKLKILEKARDRFVLDALELGTASIASSELSDTVSVDDIVEVFLYHNSKSELVATTKKVPTVGQIAYLQVKSITKIGAFLDWGLEKDLFVPLAEQHRPLEVGKSYIVYLYLDKVSGRITASSKVNKFITDYAGDELKPNQEVDLVIANSTNIGYKAIINSSYWGIIYSTEVFRRLSFGQALRGYIKNIRDDGRIDLSLQLVHKDLDKNAELVEKYLIEHNGSSPFNDKSNPDDIVREFGISKAAFKRAIGTLLKKKKIIIRESGIYLNG
ncbi:GntR family transcriptional regulator [Francisella philomiragia]|uniref:S1 motif domain-containing protein n=1 Tax=Francisella philomiragia subsp. philomiragia (strain ATCC 25017 / CCUG 19701 / FSC 153 / O\|nr:S1-like domain-containing RNA-binding protein [Francisella philomiragia]AJI46911.1 S1 RNA binding domain protein [Francisella philomiragia]AJI49396.1 S1 RNA binding domain protein [Francisella philomiragia]MBK2021220.1 GntR family transcriptional regulator [Francisella philomiragia]MBK2030726.1 GntR family transcriptional regulator [Francisella philomiragia]MBK2263255.1 GntR family transcriptional regulator [Francisella philomiragia]